MYIPTETIEEIRSSAEIVDIISGYVTLKKKGRNYFGLCPFHQEKTPSFSVNPEKQIFHCFGCGEGGNSISFIMKVENLPFADAVRFLAKKFHIEIPEIKVDSDREKEKLALYDVNRFVTDHFIKHLQSEAGSEARNYLKERGFEKTILEQFEIGYAPTGWDNLIKAALKFGFSMDQLKAVGLVIPNKSGGYYDRFRERIIFPIHNLSGLVVGFGGRILKDQPDSPKYINSPETSVYQKSKILYGLFQNRDVIRKQESALLVEGYADVLGLNQGGIENAVASSGTSLTVEQARLLLRYTPNVTILYDGDLAGANAALRGVDILLQQGLQVKVALLPEGSDPDSYVKENGKDALLHIVKEAHDLIDFKIIAFKADKPVKTPQQQAELVNLLAESVSEIQDEVLRNLYIQEIAKKLKLSETIVFRAVAKKKRRQRRNEDITVPVVEPEHRSSRLQAEREIVEVCLRFPQMIPVIYKHIALAEIKSDSHRQVIEQIYEQYVNTGKVHAQSVLDSVEDQELQKFIVKAMMTEEEVQERTLRQLISDCIKKIKMDNLKQEVEKTQEAIKYHEGKKDFKSLQKFQRIYSKLKKEEKELRLMDFVPLESEV